jgi:hypothetical protein
MLRRALQFDRYRLSLSGFPPGSGERSRYGAEGLIFRGGGSMLVVQLYNQYAEL